MRDLYGLLVKKIEERVTRLEDEFGKYNVSFKTSFCRDHDISYHVKAMFKDGETILAYNSMNIEDFSLCVSPHWEAMELYIDPRFIVFRQSIIEKLKIN